MAPLAALVLNIMAYAATLCRQAKPSKPTAPIPKRTRVPGSGAGTGLYWYVTVPVNSASVTCDAAVFPPVFAVYVWVKVEAGNTIVPGPLNSARIAGRVSSSTPEPVLVSNPEPVLPPPANV